MFRMTAIAKGAAIAALLSMSPAYAQAPKTITMEQAMAAYQGALNQAKKDGSDFSLTVLDRDGQVVLQARGSAASPHNLELSRRKALTALTFKMPSLAWQKKTLSADPDHERDMPDVIPLGGGVPVMDGNDVIGAVGASGTKGNQDGDEACAQAGADAIVPHKVAGN